MHSVRRFGGALNLNPHLHSLSPDGLFVEGRDGRATFVPLPSPTDEDVRILARRLAKRLGAIARRRLAEAGQREWDPDRAALHVSAGEALRLPLLRDGHDDGDKPLCARVDGFSLHAARTVAPADRDGLERLCRYGLRAPFSQDRLSLDPDGQVRCRLLRPWPTPSGRTDLVLDPVAFLRRLAALVPAPYQNLTRYHGVFANRSRLRPLLPAPPPRFGQAGPLVQPPVKADANAPSPRAGTKHAPRPPRHLSWASLLKRVMDIDALTCPKCNVSMVVLAFLTDPIVLRRILEHLHLPAEPPPIAPARCPFDAQDMFFDEPNPGLDEQGGTITTGPGTARAPP